MSPNKRQATFGLPLYDRQVARAIHRIKICQPQAVKEQRIDAFVAALMARSEARRR